MPKTTHQHQKDSTNTDRKFRPDDEGIYAREKQEFKASEQEKRSDDDAPERKSQRTENSVEE
jgi:hypothetical protein